MNNYEKTPKLGEMLLKAGLVTQYQLEQAMKLQNDTGNKLGACVVELGFLSDETLTNFLAKQQGLQVINLDEIVLPENLIRKFSKTVLMSHLIVPVWLRNDVLTLATSDPTDFDAINDIQLISDHKVELVMAPRKAIAKTLEEFYKSLDTFQPHPHHSQPQTSHADGMHKPEQHAEAPKRMVNPRQAEEILAAAKKLGLSPLQMQTIIVHILAEKGLITAEEFSNKARQIITP